MRKCVDYQRAAFGRRHRAGISREAEGFHRIDIRHTGELVYFGNEEDRHQLIRNADQVREACHDLAHRHFIKEDDLLVQLSTVAVFLVALGQENKVFRNIAEDIIDHQMAHLQCAAALTHDVLIHEPHTAHVGNHPAIPEGGIQSRDQVLGEGGEEHAPHPQPFLIVVSGVLHTAPLTAHCCHGTFAVKLAEALFSVNQEVFSLFGRHSHHGFEFFRDTAPVILEIIQAVIPEFFPVRLLEHVDNNAADFQQVFSLLFPVHIVFCAEECGIRIFDFCSGHQFLPPFFWMRLISSDSTNAWKRVRSWPEVLLL